MEKNMTNILDEILMSDEVVKRFHDEYENENFYNWINSIVPEIEECRKLKQDNPWHIYNCLDHILHSVEEINKQTKQLDNSTRRLLAYTMFLHDIGKPECYLRRYSKLYKREVDSFFNHNIAGVKIADRVVQKFGFNLQEKEMIKALINDHDIFMFITLKDDGNKFHHVLTEQLIREHINKLSNVQDGKTMMKFLLMVGRADNKSQNPEMTKESLHLIDVMEEMLTKM